MNELVELETSTAQTDSAAAASKAMSAWCGAAATRAAVGFAHGAPKVFGRLQSTTSAPAAALRAEPTPRMTVCCAPHEVQTVCIGAEDELQPPMSDTAGLKDASHRRWTRQGR